MRKNLGPKTYLFPMPVLIIGTYDEKGVPNAMNAAWGGIYDTNQIFICLASNHKTTDNIKLNKEFSVSFADKNHVKECDYFGIRTGYKEDKISKANFHVEKSNYINAPLFNELPVAIECKVNKLDEIDGTVYLVGYIINVSVDEKMMTNNKFDSSKFTPISFDASDNTYREITNKIGHAFKDGLEIK